MEKNEGYSTKLRQARRLRVILALFEKRDFWTQSQIREELKMLDPQDAKAKMLERDLEDLTTELKLIQRHDFERCPVCDTVLRGPRYSLKGRGSDADYDFGYQEVKNPRVQGLIKKLKERDAEMRKP